MCVHIAWMIPLHAPCTFRHLHYSVRSPIPGTGSQTTTTTTTTTATTNNGLADNCSPTVAKTVTVLISKTSEDGVVSAARDVVAAAMRDRLQAMKREDATDLQLNLHIQFGKPAFGLGLAKDGSDIISIKGTRTGDRVRVHRYEIVAKSSEVAAQIICNARQLKFKFKAAGSTSGSTRMYPVSVADDAHCQACCPLGGNPTEDNTQAQVVTFSEFEDKKCMIQSDNGPYQLKVFTRDQKKFPAPFKIFKKGAICAGAGQARIHFARSAYTICFHAFILSPPFIGPCQYLCVRWLWWWWWWRCVCGGGHVLDALHARWYCVCLCMCV